jgi:hypothetical protein
VKPAGNPISECKFFSRKALEVPIVYMQQADWPGRLNRMVRPFASFITTALSFGKE